MMENGDQRLLARYPFAGACVIDEPNGVSFPSGAMTLPADKNEIITLETPKAEEIARAIWQRQHAALPAESLSYHKQWRDQSISPRFWNEFLLDAHAVLSLLQEKHDDYRNARSQEYRNSYRALSSGSPPARHCARDRPSS